jgi:hypothetical protein
MAKPGTAQLLLDSNLFLLLAIGSYDTGLIQTFKRVGHYSLADYKILAHFASGFRDIIVTPHVLTEVSNLANSLQPHVKGRWFDHLSMRIAEVEERQVPAEELAALPEFRIFGLTDAALSFLADTLVVATADERLRSHLQRRGLQAIGFDEIRARYRQSAQ